MDYYEMTNNAILKEIGKRIKRRRLNKNMTQKTLGEQSMKSLNSIKRLEDGKGSIETLVAVLRELHALDELDSFVKAQSISPLQVWDMQGKVRQRAAKAEDDEEYQSEW